MSSPQSPDDHSRAAALDSLRDTLRRAGGETLPPRPWQQAGPRPDDTELVRLAAWRASDPDVDPEVVAAGLGLLSAAREELDQSEAALLFAARAAGMTFQQIAGALDLGSGQAAQQRMARVLSRLEQS